MTKPSSKRKKVVSTSSSNSTPPDNQDLKEDPATAIITVTAVEVPELTEQEQSDRLHLERKVERAVFEAGKALMELRDRRLYRSTHKTFEDYCRERFGYTRRQPYLLMEAAVVFDNLIEKCDRNDHILPTNEWQVRPLTKLDPDIQPEAWQQAVESANGKVPSHRIVKDAVQRIMERTQVPNTYQLGEVCQILAKDNPELRGKGGCWGIVSQVNDFSCTVKTWDGEYTVGLPHLKSFNYLPQECQQMQLISDRINRLQESENLEETARAVLKYLGELKRPYLTAVEEKLLSLIEQESGIRD
ncbi:hypothetical protein WKK05_13125 [Nostoc sp. UHCC 0302]|uniref:hypothetical protein n=1 Tax=Nostoc sp. UHCC 0302 TaxID=3134896 RepID=UPI00311CDB23